MQQHLRRALGLRTASSVAILAMGATLALAPAALSPAGAVPATAGAERTTVTAECAAAQAALSSARAGKARAHHKVVKARKALRKAKHTHRPALVHKAKRLLKKRRHRYAVRSHNVHVQAARVGYACSAPNSAARASGTGIELDLLAIATGAAGKVLDATQLTALLDELLPGASGQLDPAQLNALLSGFNAGAPSLDDVTILLGSVFTPEELQALLAGTADPTVVLALTDHIIGELSGLSGVDPGTLDATALQTIVDSVTSLFGGLADGGTDGGGVVCTLLPILC
jgi:hypothetical protein